MEWTFSDSVRLSLLSFSEASKACAALPGFSLFRRSLQPERIEYCRAELLPLGIECRGLYDNRAPAHR